MHTHQKQTIPFQMSNEGIVDDTLHNGHPTITIAQLEPLAQVS